jgi:hypothetical protein
MDIPECKHLKEKYDVCFKLAQQKFFDGDLDSFKACNDAFQVINSYGAHWPNHFFE